MTVPFMPDEEEKRFARASFASWKFDLIKAIMLDPNVRHSDFRVAVALIGHLNAKTMQCYPPQDVLARETSMTPRSVFSCIERLRDIGWLQWQRGNRQLANEYHFVVDKIAEAKRQQRELAARLRSSDRKPASGQKTILTGSQLHVATGSQLHTNTLNKPAPRSRRIAK